LNQPTKILIVDDSVVSRKFLSDLLGLEADFEVMGTAANGKIAMTKVAMQEPDLIVLDVEMPVMDGIETLKALKHTLPGIHVIMFSAHTKAGASVTVEALTLGAADYVTKPSNLLGRDEAQSEVSAQLVPKIRALVGRPAPQPTAPPLPTAVPPPPAPDFSALVSAPAKKITTANSAIDIVAIGSSTGGPNALVEIFAALPADFPVPIVVVQHMPATFTAMLAERLTRQSALQVEEAREGVVLLPGQAWVAPGGQHLALGRRLSEISTRLNLDPPENSCRPAVDVLFRSVAAAYRQRALGVVLTGMGEDGRRGAQEMRQGGAQIIAQDRESSVVWGMAGAVTKSGAADKVLPLAEIGAEIVRRARLGR
jgi:two-component system, chemotaxis family, protein-glutamate methylesterase/glutaminase